MQAAAKLRQLFTSGAPRAATAQPQAAQTPSDPPVGFPPQPKAVDVGPLAPLSAPRSGDGIAQLSINHSPFGSAPKAIRTEIASFLDHESGLALAGTSRTNHEEQLGALHERYARGLLAVREYLRCDIEVDEVMGRIRDNETQINLGTGQNESGNSRLHVLKAYLKDDKKKLESLLDQKDGLQYSVDDVLKCQIDHGMHHQTVWLRVNIAAAVRQKSPAELVAMYSGTFHDAIAATPLIQDAPRLADNLNSLALPGTASFLQDSLGQLVATLDERLRAEACIAVVHWADVQPVATAQQSYVPIDHDAPD